MPARTLTVLGTSSSVGKSLLVAALCRIMVRRGVRVAPFKAQNMSNNAAVCPDGAEIGRAQALQAAAAKIAPSADMNPVLLKPEAESRAQVVVLGRAWQTLSATSYFERKRSLWPTVTAALDRLRAGHELVIIEGAGSPVELNLRSGDLANMAVARHARSSVLLVGDIDRGGIFAQLLGTLWLLEPEERGLVRGLVVNKFRGDRKLFDTGVRMLAERAELPVLGVVPFLRDLALPEEDAATLEVAHPGRAGGLDIAVVRLPRIANFDDVDPLRSEPGVRVRFVGAVDQLGQPDAVILPGTKSTIADLAWLRGQGFDQAIGLLAARGVAVVGLCGGYQMLGRAIYDPHRVESDNGAAPGLGLLPATTVFHGSKATFQATAVVAGGRAWAADLEGTELAGYEIHMGSTDSTRPWLSLTGRNGDRVHVADGAMSDDGKVWGTYLHGVFANDALRRAWLASLGTAPAATGQRSLDAELDRLADAVAAALDLPLLDRIIAAQDGGA